MTKRNLRKARRRANRLRRESARVPPVPERDSATAANIIVMCVAGAALGLMAWLAWLH